MKRRAAAGSPAPWRTCQNADVRRDAIANRMLGMGDHRPAVGRGRMMAVGTFDVCCNAAVNSDLSCFLYTLQRQSEAAVFALPDRLSVTMVISSRRQKHLFPLPLPLRYATVLCFAAMASVRLVCGPQPP